MIIRPSSNAHRDTILRRCESWLLIPPPPEQLSLYVTYFKAEADAYRAATDELALLTGENDLAAVELSSANIEADDVSRGLFTDVSLKHGPEGVRKVEGLFGGRTRSEFTRLAHRDQAALHIEALKAVDSGNPAGALLDAGYLAQFRAATTRLVNAVDREDITRSARHRQRDVVDNLRPSFDKGWTRFAAMIGPMLGTRMNELIPDFSNDRAKKAKSDSTASE